MKYINFLVWILMLTIAVQVVAQVDANKNRKMAIFLSGEGTDENFIANKSSVNQLINVSGIPSTITDDFNLCLNYGLILFPSLINEGDLSETQINQLIQFVENGGSIIFSGISEPKLYEIAGIDNSQLRRNRAYLSFTSSLNYNEMRWIDDPYEREIKLGATTYSEYFETFGYRVTDAEVFGLFRDGRAGVIKASRNNAYVYSLGFSLRDLIIRNLLNRDFNASRVHAELFDATSDVVMLLIRGMYAEVVKNAVWLSPAPYDSKSVLIITHDVCSHTAHIFSNDFALEEYNRGFAATYNITTHQFIDDINGDNYSSHIPQMRMLLNRNHVIGSHSYGHFPDFSNGEIFPEGVKLSSISEYDAYFSIEEGQTVGGTVFGELGISKILLENDLNIDVKAHRSGHLAVNPYQYDVLNELGFIYSSSFTSRNVLTGFPYFMHAGRAMNGEPLPIIETPISSSDVLGAYTGDPIDEFNWKDKAELWRRVTEKYANNNAPSNILIHPNRNYKLDAMIHLLDEMSQDIMPFEMTAHAEFWKEKSNVQFSTNLQGNVLKIYANEAFFANEAFSLVLDFPNGVETIELYDENNQQHGFFQKEYYLGTALLYQKAKADLKDIKAKQDVKANEILHQNFPNPFSFSTTISYDLPDQALVSLKVLDMYGRVIEELVNENQSAGLYEIEYNHRNRSAGIYFYQINIQTTENYLTATQKMLVK